MSISMSCNRGFEGNSDIYGMGVRLGIYLQWFTSIFAENFHKPAVDSARDTDSTYQLAMTSGFMFITTNPATETKAVEGHIALLFCFAGSFKASLQNGSAFRQVFSKGNDTKLPTRRIRSAADMILSAIICSHGTWFLHRGMDNLERTECPEIAFFFAPVALFGWFGSVMKALFAVGLVGSASMLIIQGFVVISGMPSSLDDLLQRRITSPHQDQTEDPQQSCILVKVSLRQLLGSLFALGLFITSVETTLVWNNISGVWQCAEFSQLFPLMIGATNAFRLTAQFCLLYAKGEVELQWRDSDGQQAHASERSRAGT